MVTTLQIQYFSDGDYAIEGKAELSGRIAKMVAKKSEEDRAIAELLEPLQKQIGVDYARPHCPKNLQKPLLNNDWAGLAEKVWLKFKIKKFFSGDYSTVYLGELLGSECAQRGYKSNLEGLP